MSATFSTPIAEVEAMEWTAMLRWYLEAVEIDEDTWGWVRAVVKGLGG